MIIRRIIFHLPTVHAAATLREKGNKSVYAYNKEAAAEFGYEYKNNGRFNINELLKLDMYGNR